MNKTQAWNTLLTKSRKLTIAAIDHRGLLKTMLHPENPETTTTKEIKLWKQTMVDLYKEHVSGLLIDPTYGEEMVNPGVGCGWLLSLEQTGYRGSQSARETELIPGWNPRRCKEVGAVGAKLLLYFDPENRDLAKKQVALARLVAEQCSEAGILMLLEPLTYRKSHDPYVVEKIVDEFAEIAIDIFKLEYPGDLARCQRISQKLSQPWVLLSAGADYNSYLEQLQIACQSGASGMAVGRAAWQEFGRYEGVDREHFLQSVALPRIIELGKIVEKYGKPVEIN